MPAVVRVVSNKYKDLKPCLTSLQSHVLACVVSEPGEWTTRDIWEDLTVRPEHVERSVYSLRRLGLLETHEGYSIQPKYENSGRLRGSERDVYQIVLKLAPAKLDKIRENCPLAEKHVQKILIGLEGRGAITGYYSLWPTSSGRELVYERVSRRG